MKLGLAPLRESKEENEKLLRIQLPGCGVMDCGMLGQACFVLMDQWLDVSAWGIKMSRSVFKALDVTVPMLVDHDLGRHHDCLIFVTCHKLPESSSAMITNS